MKHSKLLLLLFIYPASLFSQQGKVLDGLSLESKVLKTSKHYAIYLPPDYESSERSYPVLYLLHGGGGDQAEWVQRGEVKHITDEAIREGITKPLVIVMPDASGPNRGYSNNPSGTWLYEDYFFEEFIPFIEKTYRVRAGKMNRSIAGLSMGGNGTFIYALRHPGMFKAACPMSAGPGPLSLETASEQLKRRDPGLDEKQVRDWYENYSVLELIKKIPEDRKAAVRWYITCGDDDHLQNVYEGNCLIHLEMRKREIPHEFRITDGGHTWQVWRSALPEVLKFISFP